MAVGTIFTELDLDTSKFKKKQEQLLQDIKTLGTDAEHTLQLAFQNLGVTTDKVYQAMAAKAQASYDRITRSAQVSAEEQVRAQSAAVAKINSLNAEMVNNPLWNTMGVRSQAMIEAQKEAIILSYETIKKQAGITATDLVNLEVAKNAKIAALDNELNAVKIANDAKEVASAKAAAEVQRATEEKLAGDIIAWQVMEREAYAANDAFKIASAKATAAALRASQ